MITLILIVAIIIASVFLFNYFSKSEVEKVKVFDEKKIVEKFNKLIRSISPRNIETVKKDLLDCLEQYRAVKRQQFIEARTLLTNSIDTIRIEIQKVGNTYAEKSTYIFQHRAELSDYEGAKLCYEKDLYKQMENKLIDSRDKLTSQLAELDKKIMSFDTQLQLKRTQIITMINESLVLDNYSAIDLKLDNLEKEFKGEVNKLEQTKIVDEKMGNAKKEEELAFDVDHYTKVFKELK